MVGVSQRRNAARHLVQIHGVSERRACRLAGISRTAYRYESRADPQNALRTRIKDIARSRVRYGYKRIHVLLKREGFQVNAKRVHRLYCLEGLQLRQKRPRRHVSAAHRKVERVEARKPNENWAMDFVADALHDGSKLRILTVVDTFTRECLATTVGKRLSGEDVVRTLTTIASKRGKPKRIFCDNGSEFSGRATDLWAYKSKVTLAFSRPGKPTDNAFIESFNGRFRDECLNCHWFESIQDAKFKIENWRAEYNERRPHKALNNLSPLEYVASLATEPARVT